MIKTLIKSIENEKKIMSGIKRRIYRTLLFGFKSIDERLDILENHIKEIEKQNLTFKLCLKKIESDMGAVSRQTMLAKWKAIDNNLANVESKDDIITCKICGCQHKRYEYDTKISECIFNGGKLIRYICPDCGVIFGPTKFISQEQDGIDEDYWVHYLGFSEGNSIEKEERTFFMLNPQKDKIYLNYGCGKWTKSLQKLREIGYNVYGYEPYAPETDNPYLITSKDELLKWKFDGIYSHNVLEHFINPVEDLIFIKNLLKDSECKMAHCTPCYEYKYEYTRFHTFFFVGDSVNVLASKSGLEITDICNDLEKNDFYCIVYKIKND